MLGARLRTVAGATLASRPAADIGTDHGLIARVLRESRRAPWVIATEHRAGPLARAQAALADLPGVEVRGGDGLEPLRPGEVATVVLAGMGCRLMIRILARASAVVHRAERLVLQPNTEWWRLRSFIHASRWTTLEERLVAERGRRYCVFAVRPTTP